MFVGGHCCGKPVCLLTVSLSSNGFYQTECDDNNNKINKNLQLFQTSRTSNMPMRMKEAIPPPFLLRLRLGRQDGVVQMVW